MKKLVILFIAVAGFALNSEAQVTDNAPASATIVAPIAITKTVDMNFGNVAVSIAAGTVVLPPVGARTVTGGCTLPVVTGTVAPATFTVTGTGTYTYSIILPLSLTITDGSNTMTVTTFTSNPSGTGALVAGTQTLLVGATLNVAGSQVPNVYTNATGFPVTVNYN